MGDNGQGTDYSEYIGRPTAAAVVTVERAPVAAFAASVLDDKALWRNADAAAEAGFDGIPVPPTFFFSAAESWCRHEEEQPEDPTGGDNPMAAVMGSLMANGGLILHGEQAFEYHRDVVVGEKLTHRGVVKDIYEKPTGDRTMTFMVVENTYADESGEPVITATMNVIHRS
jgi:acyl dehydratase